MKTKDLILLPRWIRTKSLHVDWYNNGQLWWRYEKKNGKFHGDCKHWRRDGSIWGYKVLENGRVVKTII